MAHKNIWLELFLWIYEVTIKLVSCMKYDYNNHCYKKEHFFWK
jgi:hypothetical protein